MDSVMKYLLVSIQLVLASQLIACGVTGPTEASIEPLSADTRIPTAAANGKDTILLVSLDNGAVIMQKINASADLCFKRNSDSSTTCFTQGEPVIDPVTNNVLGFEMIENRIQLIAKFD
jgi:hypothetical protein